MKRNIMSIIILAATIINLTLTAVTLFVVIPSAKRTDNLVSKVVSIIDLELESPIPKADNSIGIEDIGTHKIAEDIAFALKKSPKDGKVHRVVVNATLSYNKKSKDHDVKAPLLLEQEGYIRETIQSIISAYDYDEILDNKENIKQSILVQLNQKFETDFIIDVNFSSFIVE